MSAGAGLAVFLLGFGVMNLFWHFDVKDPALLGLYSYRAATIGDGLCLPCITASAVFYLLSHPSVNRRERKLSWIIGVVFGLLGAAVQASWLISDTTGLNWTIPRQHYFNMAGWYHALFFAGMLFLTGVLMARIWFVRREGSSGPGAKPSMTGIFVMALFWGFGAFFLLTDILDDYSARINFFSLTGTSVCAFIVFAMLFCFTSGRRLIWEDSVSVLSGSVTAWGASLILMGIEQGTGSGDLMYAAVQLLIFLFCITFIVPEFDSPVRYILKYLLLAVPAGVIGYAGFYFHADFTHDLLMILSLACPVLTAWLYQRIYKEKLFYKYFWIGLVSVGCAVVIELVFKYKDTDLTQNLMGLILSCAVGSIISDYVQIIFDNVIECEEKLGKDPNNKALKEEKKRTKTTAYIGAVTAGLGALVLLIIYLQSLIGIAELPAADTGRAVSGTACCGYRKGCFRDCRAVVLILAVSIIILFFGKKKQYESGSLTVKASTAAILTVSYVSLLALIVSLKSPYSFSYHNLSHYFAFFMVAGAPLMTGAGFYSNNLKIRGKQDDPYVMILSIVIGAGSFAVLAALVFPSSLALSIQESTSFTYLVFFLSALAACGAFIVLPVLTARLLGVIEIDESVADNSPLSGVMQDGGLVTLMILFACFLPVLYSYFVGTSAFIFGYLSVALCLWQPLLYCIENNKHHVEECWDKVCGDPEKQQQYEALKRHVKMQNDLSIFMILPYSIIIMIIKFREFLMAI